MHELSDQIFYILGTHNTYVNRQIWSLNLEGHSLLKEFDLSGCIVTAKTTGCRLGKSPYGFVDEVMNTEILVSVELYEWPTRHGTQDDVIGYSTPPI